MLQKEVLHTKSIHDAAMLKAHIKDLQDELSVKRKNSESQFEDENSELITEISRCEMEYKQILLHHVEKNDLHDTKWRIVNKGRIQRVIDAAKFYSKFPDIFVKIATVPVAKAEDAVGKSNLDDVVDYKSGDPIWDIEPINKKK